MLFNLITLDGAASSSGMMNMLMIVGLIVVFYFFMIRPQQKKQKEIRKFREGIQKGDQVISAGGIYGKVKDIKDTYIVLEVDKGFSLRVTKVQCILRLLISKPPAATPRRRNNPRHMRWCLT